MKMPRIKNVVWSLMIVIAIVVLGIWYLNKTSSGASNITGNTVTTIPSSDKLINSFVFASLNPESDGAIDNTNYAVNLLVPDDIDLTSLTPTIMISNGATISPNSGTAEDFTNPITYTVTAQDGSTQNYTVTVTTTAANAVNQSSNTTTTQNSDKSIDSFVFAGLSPEVDGTINSSGYTINLVVPGNTDVTKLVPTITISDGATIFPNSGTAEDFTNPITYTVTAQDGSIQDYTVTVTAQTTQTETTTQ
jgi:hypothetical protein